MQSVEFARRPAEIRKYIASIFGGEVRAGVTGLPALPGQVWICTHPAYWVPHHGGPSEQLPIAGVMGPSTGAHKFVAGTPMRIYGVSFTALGWVELVRIPAASLANRIVDASAVWPKLIRPLVDAVLSARSWEEKAVHLADFVTDLVAQTKRSDEQLLLRAINQWVLSDQPPAVLSSMLGYSERQVERITARTHGGSPRFLRLRYRALRLANLLAKPADSPIDYSAYSDQSHYTREFRRFVGSTPGAFARGDHGTEILRIICAEDRIGGESQPLGLFTL